MTRVSSPVDLPSGRDRVGRMRDESPSGEFLYAEDVAKLRRISVRQAQRYLRRMQAEHGPSVVGSVPGRRAPRLYTTATALEKVGPGHHDRMMGTRERIEYLESEIERLHRDHERRLQFLENIVFQLMDRRPHRSDSNVAKRR